MVFPPTLRECQLNLNTMEATMLSFPFSTLEWVLIIGVLGALLGVLYWSIRNT